MLRTRRTSYSVSSARSKSMLWSLEPMATADWASGCSAGSHAIFCTRARSAVSSHIRLDRFCRKGQHYGTPDRRLERVRLHRNRVPLWISWQIGVERRRDEADERAPCFRDVNPTIFATDNACATQAVDG